MKTLFATTLLLSGMHAALAQTTQAATTTADVPLQITRNQTRTITTATAQNFTGTAKVEMLFVAKEPLRASAGLVTFEQGARTHWHTHPLGQTLVVTAGIGRVQRWGGPIEEIRTGDVVHIPPGVKHWHGASPTSGMTHMALSEALNGNSVDWLEAVTDAQFQPAGPAASAAPQPSRSQQLMGSVAPKLAQLTDDVLFGDVWSRPGLSRRDRSLATVSALIAMNRPDQLRSHLALARTNGMTETELVEVITQLAFYAGWPSGVSAALVAKEVFGKP